MTHIPSADEIKALLCGLSHSKVSVLSGRSGVPFTTLWKIRMGDTPNPRIGTVRKFFPLLAGVAAEAEAA